MAAPHDPDARSCSLPGANLLDDWLAGTIGRLLLEAERAAVAQALENVFGNQCLQLGHWGPPDAFLSLARIPRRALIAEPGAPGDCISHASSLAILSQSVDAVLLPHTLEYEPEPHEVLREVERVLVGEGHVVILGFEPSGAWALRHRLVSQGFPPGLAQHLSRGRLRDWLRLLGFDVVTARRFLHAPPLERLARGGLARGLEHVGAQMGGHLGSLYLIKARKRVYTLTPIRPKRRRLPVLAGAAVRTSG